MTTNEKITSLFAQNNGILKMAKALESGVPKSTFYAYVKKHGAKRGHKGSIFHTMHGQMLCICCISAVIKRYSL